MPFDNFKDFEHINEERSKAIRKSLRTIGVEELKKLADEIFHSTDDPWREKLLQLIAENPYAAFYHAVTSDHVVFLYSPDEDIGLWFLPGSGMGPLRETGKRLMKEAIEQHG
jgi:hypothetical protein